MNEKRFFIDKIDDNQYAIYDRLKIGYIEPLVYTDWTVGLDYTQSICDLFNDCDEKMNEVYEKLIIGKGSSEVIDMIKFGDNLYGVTIKELFDRNKKLEEDIDNEKNDYRELFSNYIYLQEKNVKLIKENKQLKLVISQLDEHNTGYITENLALRKENEKLKAKLKRLQNIATRTEAEKEEYADLYCKCENELIKNGRRCDDV